MPDIRMIAMDMDGTLLKYAKETGVYIPAENAAVLHRCAAAGIHLALCSGRMPDDAGFFALDEGLPMHVIGLNGGVILDHPADEPVYERYLPEAIARRVLAILMEYSVDVAVFGAWEVVSMQDRPLSWAQLALGTYFGRDGGLLVYRNCGEGVDALLSRTGKIVALAQEHPDMLAEAKARIHAAFPELCISSSWQTNFEVNPAGTDKGSALQALADRLHIPMSQVMAIGDNDNDIPMLKAAGYGVAMGNATASAKAAARCITLSNDECGVAAAIRALVFGESVPGMTIR